MIIFKSKENVPLKLYHEPFFKYAFSEQRKIEKIHLPELKPHTNIIICKNPVPSQNKDDILFMGTTNADCWMIFSHTLIVMAGDIFYAIEQESS